MDTEYSQYANTINQSSNKALNKGGPTTVAVVEAAVLYTGGH